MARPEHPKNAQRRPQREKWWGKEGHYCYHHIILARCHHDDNDNGLLCRVLRARWVDRPLLRRRATTWHEGSALERGHPRGLTSPTHYYYYYCQQNQPPLLLNPNNNNTAATKQQRPAMMMGAVDHDEKKRRRGGCVFGVWWLLRFFGRARCVSSS